MALSGKPVSDDSSTDANHSSSDDHNNRFYSQPLIRRQSSSSPSSSSASSDSESDDSSGPPDLPKRSSSHKPEAQSSTPVNHPPKAAKDAPAKRPREDNGEDNGDEEEDKDVPKPPPKKKIAQKKADAGKKSQSQPVLKKPGIDMEEKIPSKKRIVASSPPGDESAALAVKDSAQKSGKKAQHAWSADDEVALVKGVLALFNADAHGGKPPELPKNMVPIYEQVKHFLSRDYSNSQLYDKMRRMKSKFQTINEKLKTGDGFSFKNPHDATMFGLWKQLWRGPSNSIEVAGQGNAVTDGDVEDERKSTEKEREVQEEEEEEEENEKPKDTEAARQFKKNQKGKRFPSAGQAYNGFREESRAVVNEVRNDLQKMMEDAHLRTASLVDSLIKVRTLSLQRPYSDPVNGIYRTKGLPVLNSKNAQPLERKWREQHILEMEAFSRRLDLLQEECRVGLEELKSHEDVGRA